MVLLGIASIGQIFTNNSSIVGIPNQAIDPEDRFANMHISESNHWVMRISVTEIRSKGLYEVQAKQSKNTISKEIVLTNY